MPPKSKSSRLGPFRITIYHGQMPHLYLGHVEWHEHGRYLTVYPTDGKPEFRVVGATMELRDA